MPEQPSTGQNGIITSCTAVNACVRPGCRGALALLLRRCAAFAEVRKRAHSRVSAASCTRKELTKDFRASAAQSRCPTFIVTNARVPKPGISSSGHQRPVSGDSSSRVPCVYSHDPKRYNHSQNRNRSGSPPARKCRRLVARAFADLAPDALTFSCRFWSPLKS